MFVILSQSSFPAEPEFALIILLNMEPYIVTCRIEGTAVSIIGKYNWLQDLSNILKFIQIRLLYSPSFSFLNFKNKYIHKHE